MASAGELHLALAGGFDPARVYMHGNNKTQEELDYARERGVGHIVVDSFDEIDRLEGSGQRVLIRVTPGIKASTHSYIQTGQADSKFGFPLADVPRAVERCARGRPRACAGCTRTSARRCSSSRRSRRWPRSCAGWATGRC